MSDVLQVRISDIGEVFASFPLAELPLKEGSILGLSQFVQVGSKQLLLNLNFELDSSMYADKVLRRQAKKAGLEANPILLGMKGGFNMLIKKTKKKNDM